MDTERYKRQLLAEEKRLQGEVSENDADARDLPERPSGDAMDRSLNSERKEMQFQMGDREWTLLEQVRSALARIEDGTYGQCIVDGEPISEKRLDAMPWTPYCLKHQQSIEAAHPEPMPTL